MSVLIPQRAGDYDFVTQDTVCAWCPDVIGQADYVATEAGELFHTACWDEVTASTPDTEAVA